VRTSPIARGVASVPRAFASVRPALREPIAQQKSAHIRAATMEYVMGQAAHVSASMAGAAMFATCPLSVLSAAVAVGNASWARASVLQVLMGLYAHHSTVGEVAQGTGSVTRSGESVCATRATGRCRTAVQRGASQTVHIVAFVSMVCAYVSVVGVVLLAQWRAVRTIVQLLASASHQQECAFVQMVTPQLIALGGSARWNASMAIAMTEGAFAGSVGEVRIVLRRIGALEIAVVNRKASAAVRMVVNALAVSAGQVVAVEHAQ